MWCLPLFDFELSSTTKRCCRFARGLKILKNTHLCGVFCCDSKSKMQKAYAGCSFGNLQNNQIKSMIRQFYVVFEIQKFKRVMLAVHLKNAYYNKNRYIYMSCDLYHSLGKHKLSKKMASLSFQRRRKEVLLYSFLASEIVRYTLKILIQDIYRCYWFST